ncbi:MAG: RagB/SusD family nutrient uptake outer membrane protein [Chitinophagaceae bacterium]|nr:RagB/SusD family nutrient uptake outer membrane protein [Chitinophagaceae bacterium]
MKKLVSIKTLLLAFAVLLASCNKKLERFPPNSLTSKDVYVNEAGYFSVLAKVYGSMALTGNQGPAGSGDVAGIDEGTSDFLRLFWKAQELSTDEAVVAWNDPGIQDFHNMNWAPANPMLKGLYFRCIYIVTLSNEFIRESAPDKVSSRGISGTAADNIKRMRAEARFVRAFANWVLMDLYANPSFTTEADGIGKFNPPQTNRAQLFTYIESELKAIEGDLSDPRTAAYGRADKAAAWSLLARIYLNAQVYVPTLNKVTDAVTYSKRVIDAGYSLLPDYRWLMLADNNLNNPEFIWTLNYDGAKTQNFGGTTFLVNASVGGDMDRSVSGLGGWGGIRTTKNLPQLFPDLNGTGDKRAQFVQGTQNLEINNISEFKDGLAVIKYRNRTRSGGFGQDATRTFSDVDFPVFRLAEMYLIYAEAVKRGGTGGTEAQALTYLNALRNRAQVTAADIGSYDLDYVLNERARELYWEGFRRSDLIRYNRFTEATYLWPWKGGVLNGTGVDARRKIYPIPDSELAANPNMKQNDGY